MPVRQQYIRLCHVHASAHPSWLRDDHDDMYTIFSITPDILLQLPCVGCLVAGGCSPPTWLYQQLDLVLGGEVSCNMIRRSLQPASPGGARHVTRARHGEIATPKFDNRKKIDFFKAIIDFQKKTKLTSLADNMTIIRDRVLDRLWSQQEDMM